MPTCEERLPDGYVLYRELDLVKDRKLMLLANGLALLVMLVLAGVYLLLQVTLTGSVLFELPHWGDSYWGIMGPFLIFLIVLFGSTALYMVLHELVHGVFIKRYCGKSAKYGFNGLYAFAGRDDMLFYKGPYIIIALAPVILFGILFFFLLLFASGIWFTGVYFLQMMNLSGAAGDLYACWVLRKVGPDALINDSGTSMRIYCRSTAE
ncbi:MAG: DUF3267 domain-containing protein [Clostridiales bacterium]|nr:DUF3267 domain-containing protein [Clostridiales bacterium]